MYDKEKLIYQQANNIQPSECSGCFEAERELGTSTRLEPKPSQRKLSLITSNICNLKCDYCYGGSRLRHKERTQIFPELNIKPLKREFVTLPDVLDYDIYQVSGGEIFFDSYSISLVHEIISRTEPGTAKLRLVTNGTIFNPEFIKECQKHFRVVALSVSIDGYRKANDYLRYESKFKEVIENVSEYRELGVEVNIVSVLSNISLITIHQLNQWCKDNNLSHKIRLLSEPAVFSPNNITNKLKDQVLQNIKNMDPADRSLIIRAVKNNTNDMSDILEYLKRHDKHRNIDLLEYIPALNGLI